MPAGERARKRRAAQAAFLPGASRTPLACGHQDNAPAGVLLPLLPGASRKESFRNRNSFDRSAELLRGFVAVSKTRMQSHRENERPHPEVLGAFASSLEGCKRRLTGPHPSRLAIA